MQYVIAPWEWHTNTPAVPDSGYWMPPAGSMGDIDLRPTQARGKKAVAEGFGLFILSDVAPVPTGGILLGNRRTSRIAAADRIELAARTGVAADDLDTANIAEAIWRLRTDLADARGENFPFPLVKDSKGQINLYAGLPRPLKVVRFNKNRDTFIRARLMNEIANRTGETKEKLLAEAVLDYGFTRQELTAPAGGATVGDDFTEASETVLASHTPTGTGGFSSWTDTSALGNLRIKGTNASGLFDKLDVAQDSNTSNTGDGQRGRADVDLTVNHYVTVDVEHSWSARAADGSRCGVIARYASGADSGMAWIARNVSGGELRMWGFTTGTFTARGTETTFTVSLPHTVRVEADGSGVRGLFDAVEKQAYLTDDNGGTNTRPGVLMEQRLQSGSDGDPYMDTWEAGDLGAVPGDDGSTRRKRFFILSEI